MWDARRRDGENGAVTDVGEGRTLRELLAELEAHGFTGQFAARPGATVECFACHHVAPAAEIELVALRRLEGASDPADMLAVLALVCPRYGCRGTAVLNYGPEASIEDAELLLAVEDRRPREPEGWAV